MKVIVEFDLVDCSMWKHRNLMEHIYEKYSWAMRDCRIIEPEIYDIRNALLEREQRKKEEEDDITVAPDNNSDSRIRGRLPFPG